MDRLLFKFNLIRGCGSASVSRGVHDMASGTCCKVQCHQLFALLCHAFARQAPRADAVAEFARWWTPAMEALRSRKFFVCQLTRRSVANGRQRVQLPVSGQIPFPEKAIAHRRECLARLFLFSARGRSWSLYGCIATGTRPGPRLSCQLFRGLCLSPRLAVDCHRDGRTLQPQSRHAEGGVRRRRHVGPHAMLCSGCGLSRRAR